MKKVKRKARVEYYIPEDDSDEVVAEMKSKLVTLNRNQLEMLICTLSQEIVRLEHKLESYSSSILNSEKKNNKNTDYQANDEMQSETSSKTLQRILRSVTSMSQFGSVKSGDIIQQQERDKEQLFISDDFISNNEMSCDGHQSNIRNTDIDLPYSNSQASPVLKNIEDHPLASISCHNEKSVKTQTVSDRAFHEDLMFLKGEKFSRERTENDAKKCLSDEQHASCEGRHNILKTHQRNTVGMERLQLVTSVDNGIRSVQSCDSSEHVNLEKISPQNKTKMILSGCHSRSVQNGKVQPLGNNKKCKLSMQSSNSNLSEVPVETTEGKKIGPFLCSFCKIEFQSELILVKHMKTEHKHVQYSCMLCGKSFRYKHNLKIHQRNSHNQTTVLCSYCGKLVLQTRLDTHLEKVHEKPLYTCHICQKGFLKRECLEGHINKHSNTKPYICEYCGRKYAYSTSLSSHRKLCVRASMPPHLQHPRSVDNKGTSCICEICGVKFEGVSGLKDHLSAKHSNKIQYCSFCGKGFHWRPSYNRHIKKCKDKTDLERERCRRLMYQKPVGKQYVCVCGKKYPYRQSYRRHERNCHQKQEVESYMTSCTAAEVPFSEYLGSTLELSSALNLQG